MKQWTIIAVFVLYAISITVGQPQENYYILKGGTITLRCSYPNDAGYVKWYTGSKTLYTVYPTNLGGSVVNRVLPNSLKSRVKLSEDAKTVDISNAELSDGASYQCKYYKSGYITPGPYMKYFIAEPVVIKDVVNGRLPVMKSTDISTIQCQTKIHPSTGTTPDIQWNVGADILEFPTVITNNNDVYIATSTVKKRFDRTFDGKDVRCRLLKDGGVIVWSETSAKMNIQYEPYGVSVKSNKPASDIKEGDNIQLTCNAEGAKPGVSSYKWKHNGKDHSDGKVLSLMDIKSANSGSYSCSAINEVGSTESSEQEITVQHLIVSLTLSPDTPIREGNSVTLKCIASGYPSHTAFTYHSWYHMSADGTKKMEIPDSEGKKELRISKVEYTDAGVYSCSVSNIAFIDKSASKELAVQYSPKEDPSAISISEVGAAVDEDAYFTLRVIAEPPTTSFKWFHGGINSIIAVNDQTKYTSTGNSSTFTFNKVKKTDYGNYTCQVENAIGSSKFVFELKPKGPASVPRDFKIVNRTAVSVTLSWISAFNGGTEQTFNLEYKMTDGHSWSNDYFGITDPGQNQVVIQRIRGLQSTTSYDFRVHARNSLSKDEDGYGNLLTVETKAKPPEPENFEVTVEGTIAVVTWSPLKANVTSVVIKYCYAGTTSCKTKIVSLDKTSVQIDIEKNQPYQFQMLIYDGDEVVQSSGVTDYGVVPEQQTADAAGIAAGVIVTVIVIVIIVVVVVMMRRRMQDKKDDDPESESFGNGYGTVPAEDTEIKTYRRDDDEYTDEITPVEPNGTLSEGNLMVVYAQVNKTQPRPTETSTLTRQAPPQRPAAPPPMRPPPPTETQYQAAYKRAQQTATENEAYETTPTKVKIPPPVHKKPGLVYADLNFDERQQPDDDFRTSQATEYASIDFEKKPPPKDFDKKPPGDNLSLL